MQYKYYYDDLGQLIREDNEDLGYSYVYEYDDGGNITAKKRYAFTTGTLGTVQQTYSYSYGDSSWGDLLTSYNGESITYDTIGNPLVIGYEEFTWQGRQLTSYYDGNYATISYNYNADGILTYKEFYDSDTNELYKHYYTLSGTQIVKEDVSYVDWYGEEGEYTLVYIYDELGSPIGIKYRTPSYAENVYDCYFFEKNLQGDIVAIYNANAIKIATYTYDAWGNFSIAFTDLATTAERSMAYRNPFRYRGYYYDTNIGMYYLQSRFYNPEWGRFLNGDKQISGVGGDLLGYNMFAYCFNNPINLNDFTGNWPKWGTIAVGLVAATVAIVVTVATLGAAAPAAACTLTSMGMYIGASYATASAAATIAVSATTIAAATYAGDIAYSAVTGNSALLNTVFQGNTDAYNTGLAITSIATMGMLELAAQSPGVCFVAGTLVEAESGSVPIEEITIGTKVYAHNPDTGETELKEVVNTFVRESDELVHIKVNGEHIITTPEHPFYVPVKGWTSAIQLRAGDRLQLLNGEYVIIEQVQHELLETPVTVYNFEVEGFHTYYVTDSAILVHNTCEPNGTYEKAPYHNNGNSVKSAAPINGQAALNNSYSIGSNTTRRIGISNNQFVVFDETSSGVFHGHVRQWSELTQAMKNILWDNGIVTKNGKIK